MSRWWFAAVAVAIFVIENQLHAPSTGMGVRFARSANPAAADAMTRPAWTTATATPGSSALGLVAAGLGVTVVAASYQALSLEGVRFVPVVGHQLTPKVGWAAGSANTALPAFLEAARQAAPARSRGSFR